MKHAAPFSLIPLTGIFLILLYSRSRCLYFVRPLLAPLSMSWRYILLSLSVVVNILTSIILLSLLSLAIHVRKCSSMSESQSVSLSSFLYLAREGIDISLLMYMLASRSSAVNLSLLPCTFVVWHTIMSSFQPSP